MMVGERDALDFGVEVSRVRMIVFAMSSLLVGTAVAASGSVGYVGLIVPHLVRLTVGSDNRLVVPMSAIAGAIFVVLADTVARTAIAPRELPVGAITALIGAPLFIYLLRRN
jgi:iron complex transport system permease protein